MQDPLLVADEFLQTREVGDLLVGHLEGDLIIGAANASALVTLFDRASRYLWLADLPDGYHADGTLAAVCEILDRIPAPLRTLTWDQGRPTCQYECRSVEWPYSMRAGR